jgi:BON domain
MTLLRRLLLTFSAITLITNSAAAEEDAALSRSAYAAILKAEGLADLNIGVRAHKDGTAILWGSARPADVAKVEVVLKRVPGITSVVNMCDPTPTTDTAKENPPKLPELPTIAPPSAPVSRPTTVEKRADEPTARLLDPVPVNGPVDYSSIERVRRSNPRFARLTFDLRDGRVVIAGTGADPTAAWDLAHEIAPLVGNRDVVVGRAR